MDLFVFRSFSCNNSGGYYLVARFADPTRAAAIAHDLGELVRARAALDPDHTGTPEVAEAPIYAVFDAMGVRDGFDWRGILDIGPYSTEDLAIDVDGGRLIVEHSYCDGFGTDLGAYLEANGARVEAVSWGTPFVSIFFRTPEPPSGALDQIVEQLRAFFEHAEETKPKGWRSVPWNVGQGEERHVSLSADDEHRFFHSGRSIAFYLPLDIHLMRDLVTRLESAGAERLSARVFEARDREIIDALATARCLSCAESDLELFDRDDHDLTQDQLVCRRCGGMFELDVVASAHRE